MNIGLVLIRTKIKGDKCLNYSLAHCNSLLYHYVLLNVRGVHVIQAQATCLQFVGHFSATQSVFFKVNIINV